MLVEVHATARSQIAEMRDVTDGPVRGAYVHSLLLIDDECAGDDVAGMLDDAMEELGRVVSVDELLAYAEPGEVFASRPAKREDARRAIRAWFLRHPGAPSRRRQFR